MKILVLTSTFPSGDQDSVPDFVRSQVIEFKKQRSDLDVRVLAPNTSSTANSYCKQSKFYSEVRYRYFFPKKYETLMDGGILPNLKRNTVLYLQIPFVFLGLFIATIKEVRKFRPNVIYAHWYVPQGLVAALVSKIFRIPLYITSHSNDILVLKRIPLIGKSIVRWGVEHANKITVVSRKTEEKLKRFYTKEEYSDLREKVSVIPMGIHYDRMIALSRGEKSLHRLLFMGRLVEKKGLHLLIGALAQLKGRGIYFSLDVCGDGVEMDSLRSQVHDLGLSGSVVFHGFVTGKKKEEIYSKSAIVLIPSIDTKDDSEGLPVSIMEAMACGKIVVASLDSGGQELIQHESNGFLVESNSVDSIARVVERCLSISEEERLALTHEAMKSASDLAWSIVATKTLDFFDFDGPSPC